LAEFVHHHFAMCGNTPERSKAVAFAAETRFKARCAPGASSFDEISQAITSGRLA
jgi:hypothetical protein